MAHRYGPAPWSPDFVQQDFGFKKVTAAGKKKHNIDYDLSRGWYKKSTDWDENPKHPKMVEITDSNSGKKFKIPEDDYKNQLYFMKMSDDEAGSKAVLDYIAAADFPYSFTASGGHIQEVWYDAKRTLLEVTFTNDGAQVIYFQVPKEVYAKLEALKDSVREDGRHMLGVEFWNIVRQRGTIHGGKFKFMYDIEGHAINKNFDYYEPESGRDTIRQKLKTVHEYKNNVAFNKYLEEKLDALANERLQHGRTDDTNTRYLYNTNMLRNTVAPTGKAVLMTEDGKTVKDVDRVRWNDTEFRKQKTFYDRQKYELDKKERAAYEKAVNTLQEKNLPKGYTAMERIKAKDNNEQFKQYRHMGIPANQGVALALVDNKLNAAKNKLEEQKPIGPEYKPELKPAEMYRPIKKTYRGTSTYERLLNDQPNYEYRESGIPSRAYAEYTNAHNLDSKIRVLNKYHVNTRDIIYEAIDYINRRK